MKHRVSKRIGIKHTAGHKQRQLKGLMLAARRRRKVPDNHDLMFYMYVTSLMSAPEIAASLGISTSAVIGGLRHLNIPVRPPSHSRNWTCNVGGCSAPVFKQIHPTNGHLYGTKCEPHYRAHREIVEAIRDANRDVNSGRFDKRESICASLADGLSTSEEIAKRLNVPTRVVGAMLGRLKRKGKVAIAGTFTNGKDRTPRFLWRLVEETI